jgi:hypothetical protein
LKKVTFDNREFFMDAACEPVVTQSSVYLLPAFDEYLVGYKERKYMLASEHTRKVIGANGLFYPVILVNGKATGIWKRKTTRQAIRIEKSLFEAISKANETRIIKETKKIAAFYDVELVT